MILSYYIILRNFKNLFQTVHSGVLGPKELIGENPA